VQTWREVFAAIVVVVHESVLISSLVLSVHVGGFDE
jgi:hypothetical protein